MNEERLEEPVPPTAAVFVRRLRALYDVKSGLPITSHRPRVGRLIVAGKAAFRRSLQPFINELLEKQTRFNESVVSVAEAIYRDLGSLEGATLAMREAQNRRIAALEAQVRKLEAELAELKTR